MLIVCPNCATSYRVEPSSLTAAGRSVRCVRCRSVWFAHDPGARSDASALDAAADAPATEPAPEPRPEVPVPPPAFAADERPASFETIEAAPAGPDGMPAVEEAPAVAAEPPEHDELPASYAPMAIADAHALAPMARMSLPGETAVSEDIETVAARRAKRRAAQRRWPLPGLPTAILGLIAVNTILIGWRADVVKVVPQTASLYAAIGLPVNLRGLVFSNVTSATETHDGVPVLIVEGTIASAAGHVVEVPRLRFSVRNQNGQEVYAWTALPGRSLLPPGETLAFRSRLASPPPDGRDVTVRFFNRRDLVAGIQ